MMRSLYSGVSGLKTLQTKMDVIGNNIANVNTIGFKKSRVVFQDKLYQSLKGASAAGDNKGGTNAISIGLGMTLASIDQIHTPAPAAASSRETDMAIDGNGYFVVKTPDGLTGYTRAGAFDFDVNGNLHTADGSIVQGWLANENYQIDTSGGDVSSINVAGFKLDPPKATTEMIFSGNLDSDIAVNIKLDDTGAEVDFDPAADAPTGKSVITSKEVYDSLGNKVTLYFRYFKAELTADDPTSSQWFCDVSMDPEFQFDATNSELGVNALGDELTFDDGTSAYKVIRLSGLEFENGNLMSPDTAICTLVIPRGVNDDSIETTIDFGQITQFQASSSAWVKSQNGCTAGSLVSYTVGSDGMISGVYDNGELRSLARVALATFQNPGGLTQLGGTMFLVSNNSGDAQIGAPDEDGMGSILPSSLEMSNVDISEEFTDMIITQRGFQANSRIITASDEMLQELVNLKR